MKENTVRKELNVLIPFPSSGKLTNRQIDNRLDKIAALKQQEKELKEAREALEQEVQEALGTAELLETRRYKVRYTTVTSSRFDSKAFKAEKPKIYAQYMKQLTTRRFSFTTI